MGDVLFARISLRLLLFLIFFCFSNLFPQNNSKNFTIEKLSENVYAAIHKFGGYAICNAGIVNLGSETLIFDTFISPSAAEELKTIAENLTSNKVRYVINSHAHNDHIRGNQVFINDAVIISTHRTKELILEWEPEQLEYEKKVIDQRVNDYGIMWNEETDSLRKEELLMWVGYYNAIKESHEDYEMTPPTVTFSDSLTISRSVTEVKLISLGGGHTDSDLVMYLPNEKILYTGDLVFIENHPWFAEGNIADLKNYLYKLNLLDIDFVIPGHGPVGTKRSILEMIDYIETMEELAEQLKLNDAKEEDLNNVSIPEKYQKWWLGRFFLPNLKFIYNLNK